jgi:hypothetical protein
LDALAGRGDILEVAGPPRSRRLVDPLLADWVNRTREGD